MKLTDNVEKQKSLDLAEDSRETEWQHPSFVAELFQGRIHWDLVHPFPLQDESDRALGDAFIEKLRTCLHEHIDPEQVDRDYEIPPTAMSELAKLGCLAMKIPTEYGGLGLSQTNYNRAIGLVGSYCASTAVWLSAHQSIGVPQPLKMFGTAAQKEKFLPRFAAGATSAFALTEPEVGSDPARMQTTATPSEDGRTWTINGSKMWCTNGPIADLLVVMAQTPPKIVKGREKQQITAFIVECDSPGFSVEHICRFQGLHGIKNGLISFDNVKVPAENIIGGPGMGLKIALVTLNTGRLTLPAASSAVNKLCLKYARRWAAERIQWGQPIGKHQAIAAKLANMAATTFATEAVTWLTSAFADDGRMDIRLEAAIAKYFCTEAAWRIVDDTLQIRGGRGYESSDSLRARGEDPMPIERMQRDIRINRIIEGTSEIMSLFIAREALDPHFQMLMPMMDPRRSTGEKARLALRLLAHYGRWYPAQWLPTLAAADVANLSRANRLHLGYTQRTSRRLARDLFHTMARYQQRLEREQLILFHFVDIGTELFAMTSVLSYADTLAATTGDVSAGELADLFCRGARRRIANHFRQLRDNDNRTIVRVADGVLDGRYSWLETDILAE